MPSDNLVLGHGQPPQAADPPYKHQEYPKMIYPGKKDAPGVVVNNKIEEALANGEEIKKSDLKHLNKSQLIETFKPEDMTDENTRDEIVSAVLKKLGLEGDDPANDQD